MKYEFRAKFDLFESVIGVKPHPTMSRQILPDGYCVEAEDEQGAYKIIVDNLSDYVWNYFYAREDNDEAVNEWIAKFENSLSRWAGDEDSWTIVDENGIAFYIQDERFSIDDMLICRFYDFEIYPADDEEAFYNQMEEEEE